MIHCHRPKVEEEEEDGRHDVITTATRCVLAGVVQHGVELESICCSLVDVAQVAGVGVGVGAGADNAPTHSQPPARPPAHTIPRARARAHNC